MTLPRKVEPELLDGLAASDPVAARARRDLQRVHRVMGTCPILVTGLREMMAERSRHSALRILELGAGDGTLMLRVAHALATQWPAAELTLLDRQPLVGHATIAAYARLGWTVETRVMNVADWADAPAHERVPGNATQRWDFIISNLFLHHFAGGNSRRCSMQSLRAPIGSLLANRGATGSRWREVIWSARSARAP